MNQQGREAFCPRPNSRPISMIAFLPGAHGYTQSKLEPVAERGNLASFECSGKEAFADRFDHSADGFWPCGNMVTVARIRHRKSHADQESCEWFLA